MRCLCPRSGIQVLEYISGIKDGKLYILKEKTEVNQKGALTRAVQWACESDFPYLPKTVFPRNLREMNRQSSFYGTSRLGSEARISNQGDPRPGED